MAAARLAAVLLAGVSVAACSDAEEAVAPPPSLEERRAVGEAEAMIPAAEREAIPVPPSKAAPDEDAEAPPGPQPKPAYRTPLPGPSPAR